MNKHNIWHLVALAHWHGHNYNNVAHTILNKQKWVAKMPAFIIGTAYKIIQGNIMAHAITVNTSWGLSTAATHSPSYVEHYKQPERIR